MRMSHLKVGSAADIPLDIGELDLSQLTASLTTPSGREEPCLLKMLRNGHVGECVSEEKSTGKAVCSVAVIFLTLCVRLLQVSHLFLRRLENIW